MLLDISNLTQTWKQVYSAKVDCLSVLDIENSFELDEVELSKDLVAIFMKKSIKGDVGLTCVSMAGADVSKFVSVYDSATATVGDLDKELGLKKVLVGEDGAHKRLFGPLDADQMQELERLCDQLAIIRYWKSQLEKTRHHFSGHKVEDIKKYARSKLKKAQAVARVPVEKFAQSLG